MIIHNKIEKLFGPSAVFSGYILLIFACVATYFSWTAIPLAIVGGIMAFSYSSCYIDSQQHRYRFVVHLLGIIPVGSWLEFEPRDALELKAFKGSYTVRSRSNRQSTSFIRDFRILLIRDSDGKRITLGRYDTRDKAEEMHKRILGILSQ